jgi:non-specific serine/threonine protein kinase
MMIRLPQFNQQGLNPSMLIRPLAYKGPNDHLTQHFSEPLLYQGLQLLLENRLLHWQHEQATQWIHGEFMVTNPPLDGVGENISSELAWPLTRDGNSCSCNNSKPCSHLAALAIESKRRLDQIIYAVKDFHDRNSLWQTELNWLNQQSHDPYSNMARHRLIYLLKRDGDRFYISFYKGYLTQENKHLLKDKFEYSQINLQKVPQFVSLTDQSIIDLSIRLVQQGKALTKGNLLYFTQPDDDLCLSLFYQMVQSHRCFWKASSRPAIKLKRQNSIPEHLAQVVKNCFFDVSHNQIIVVGNASSGLPNINSIKPVITIASAEHHFAWRSARPIALDIGKVSFLINNQQKITSNQLIQSQLELTNDAKEEIAKRWRQIQAMPTPRSCHEYPVFQHYDR